MTALPGLPGELSILPEEKTRYLIRTLPCCEEKDKSSYGYGYRRVHTYYSVQTQWRIISDSDSYQNAES